MDKRREYQITENERLKSKDVQGVALACDSHYRYGSDSQEYKQSETRYHLEIARMRPIRQPVDRDDHGEQYLSERNKRMMINTPARRPNQRAIRRLDIRQQLKYQLIKSEAEISHKGRRLTMRHRTRLDREI